MPPTSVLRKLHRTLALEPSPGWNGTLPVTRTTALRDDSTLKVRSSAAAAVAAAAAAPAPVAPAVATPNQPTTYPYAYAYNPQQAQQPYRPQSAAAAAIYKPGQAAYYPGYVPATQVQPGYYGQQPYSAGQQPYGASSAQQQPYAAYSNWYSQYATQVAQGTASGRGTPQPVAVTPATVPSSYGGFFNPAGTTVAGTATPPPAAAAAAARTPAVANTVGAKPGGQAVPTAAGWATYGGQAPTLPLHLRGAGYYGQYANQQPATPVTR